MAKRVYDDEYSYVEEQDSFDEYDDYYYEKRQKKLQKQKQLKKRFHRRLATFIILLGCVFLLTIYLTGYWKTILAKFGASFIDANVNSFTEEELTYTFEVPDSIPDDYAYSKDVVNVLLVGIEGIGNSDSHSGRSDSIVLCSYNLETGAIRLISFLRDTYVAIEGHGHKKLNAAYAYGKLDLLISTLQDTYGIFINGVARVNFDEFESVIDLLGGVKIHLTEEEAKYLNKTNYISDPANRTVVPGLNRLNGNQALGYCRVRKVPTMDGDTAVNNDFGRTLRQRKVLSALFDSYKNSDKKELLSTTKKILSVITCSLTEKQISYCIEAFLKHPTDAIQSLQMPAKGYYKGEVIEGVGDCLVPDADANRAILHHFLYEKPLPEGITFP